MKKTPIIIIIALVALIAFVLWKTSGKTPSKVATNFTECVAEGSAVMESYPRQCISKEGVHFTEDIGNEISKSDLIRVSYPRPNEEVQSPLTITGEARGGWFFEASFPVFLADWDGKIIANGNATAKGDWMTSEFVPFEATLTFTADANTFSNRGTLILKKDNPSGLPQNDDALEMPVIIKNTGNTAVACRSDAKLCPDGSAVGRTGPNCEFADCPTGGNGSDGILPYNSGVKGKVMLGPTCPVMKNPPDPQCADKPYQTSISVSLASSPARVFATTNSKTDGTFEISLPPGDYVLSAKGGTTLPRCSQATATVKSVGYVVADISCDTGIR